MIIKEHYPHPTKKWCIHCGAPYMFVDGIANFGSATCNPRESGFNRLMPEPKRHEIACEDTKTISSKLKELYDKRTEALNHHEE